MSNYKSQYGQDEYLDKKIFNGLQNGIFLDIGANDGVFYSNTWFFEKIKKWKGICVEPIPSTFQKLVESRNCTNINGCIASTPGVLKFIQVSGYAEMLSGLFDHLDENHLARIDREIKQHGGSKEIIEVKSYQFNNLLKENNISHVNYCSIDTEGNEFDILSSINFDEVTIDAFSIENNNLEKKTENFMKTKGYRLVKRLGVDEIYVLKTKWPAWKFWL